MAAEGCPVVPRKIAPDASAARIVRRTRVPMLLETPKGAGKPTGPILVDPDDARNLRTLRRLLDDPLQRMPGLHTGRATA